MSTRSTSKKVLQSFHAREGLWQLFSRRAEEMDCSVDYLINEAMRLYASSYGFLEVQEAPAPRPPQPLPQTAGKEMVPTVRERPGAGSAGLPRPPGRPAPPQPSAPGPPMTRPGGPAAMPASRPMMPRPSYTPPPHQRPASTTPGAGSFPGTPGAGGLPMASSPPRPPLTLIFQGRKIPILQDQFIIGRGSKSSDLAIKDANISRKHAAVIFHNGAFYMKDLGSTNGVEYNNKPVDSKRIDEGDVFSICGYDMHFTYSA